MALSPMMQHYLEIKDKYKDCVVFYRLGDFYEMFFEDATRVSEMLGLTLTGRDCGLAERAPMCGVPFHAAEGYIAKLVSLGEKVAICEQLQDAQEAKGMVERDVIKVVTAGTVTEDKQLEENVNNYVCSAFKNDEGVSIAWADITTGEFYATEFLGAKALGSAVANLIKLSVKEIICNDEMLFACKDLPEVTKGILPKFSSYVAWAFNYSAAEGRLLKQFKASTLAAFSIAGKKLAICASGALCEYLSETQKRTLANIDGIKYISNDRYMVLDNSVIRNLELTKTLGEGKRYGSLLWLLDKTKTAMGARLMSNVVMSPLGRAQDINYRLDGVEELCRATVVRLSLVESLRQIKDIERLSGKISNGNLNPRDCVALGKSLSLVPNIKFQLSGFRSKIINDISSQLCEMDDIVSLIDKAIVVENTPTQVRDGDFIKDSFNQRLDELRKIKRGSRQIIEEMETLERDKTGIKTLKIGFNRVFGYYIEVTKSLLDKVPLHYVRRQTLANCERFVTPELKNIEEKILTSEEQSIKLEIRIFEEIKALLTQNIPQFKKISSAIAILDVIVAFAEVSKNRRYVRPEILGSGEQLVISDGRHPVIEAISKDKFIPNDTLLDESENRTMIITGPNMAGKSTYMRQTAVIALMAHLGCFVPARSAKIPIIDRIFTRVGASDNLIMDQSTFMVEMIEVASILQNATKNSLLILDEVGRGTSTYDGLSIAWAVIEHLTLNLGAKTMFATHYHELTELENKLDGVKNYKIAVRELNGSIVFLRKIMRGGANRSFGIEVASLAGVPQSVTDRAKKLLKVIEHGGVKVEREPEEEEVKVSEVEKILLETDINALSPMQAFMLLGDLVEKVKNGKD